MSDEKKGLWAPPKRVEAERRRVRTVRNGVALHCFEHCRYCALIGATHGYPPSAIPDPGTTQS